jgi:phosphotransferase system HPr (HPr) family protein
MNGGPIQAGFPKAAEESAADGARPPLVWSPDAMNGEPVQRSVIITNPMGLHFRPAAIFAKRAAEFQSAVNVIRPDGRRVNGKSMLDLLTLAAEQGTELVVEAAGSDAAAAVNALAQLLAAPAPDDGPEERPLSPKG